MHHYQVRSLINQIESHIARLALPLSDVDSLPLESRRHLYRDIARTIDDLYVYSAIDKAGRVRLSHRAELAYIYGGLE